MVLLKVKQNPMQCNKHNSTLIGSKEEGRRFESTDKNGIKPSIEALKVSNNGF